MNIVIIFLGILIAYLLYNNYVVWQHAIEWKKESDMWKNTAQRQMFEEDE